MRFAPFFLLPLTVIGLLATAPAQAQTVPNNVLHSSQTPVDEDEATVATPAPALDQVVQALQVQMAALQADNERMHHILLQQQAELCVQRGTTRASLQALHTRLNNFRPATDEYRAATRPTTAQPRPNSSLVAQAIR